MSFLSCPSCGLTVTESAVRSPFQACPRCLLRDNTQRTMQAVRQPRRFSRPPAEIARVAEARARLSGRLRGVSSA
jgi:Zn-finger nucleic acid-binding protein